MKKLLAFSLAAMMLFAAVACANGTEPAGTQAGTQTGSTQGGQSAGANDRELVVGLVKTNTNFDPYGAYGDEQYGFFQVYDTLVYRDANGALVPSAAEEVIISEDGREYLFKIRDGITFSNGTTLDADDVVFNLETGVESSYTNSMVEDIETIEKVDDKTVKVIIKNPSLAFLEKLTYIFLVEDETYKSLGSEFGKTAETVIGSGPYIVTEWKSGEMVRFKANEDYFRGAPSIKNVLFKTITDSNAAVIALQTGDIGLYIRDVPDQALADVEKNDKLTLTRFSSYVFQDIIMNCSVEPFNDLRLRQAVAYGVDRQKMLNIATDGTGTIVDYPGGPDYNGNPLIKAFPEYDLEKAKALVKEAGYEGLEVTIKTMETEPWPKLATALQGELSAIGINASVEILEMNAYSMTIWQNYDYEIAISRYWSITKDMGELMDLVRPGHSMNFSVYVNDAVTDPITRGLGEQDPEKRKAAFAEAVNIFTPDIPLIPLYYTQGTRAYSSDLTIEPTCVQYDHIYFYSWK